MGPSLPRGQRPYAVWWPAGVSGNMGAGARFFAVGGFVWARVTDALVAKIDPPTDTVVARYGPGAGSGSVAADDSAVWVTAHDINVVYRLPLH